MRIQYTSGPQITPISIDGSLFELAADWRVTVDGEEIVIPAGFVTDGASIPRFLWRVCGHPFQLPRLPVAIVHDFAYSGQWPEPAIPREYADELYYDGLVERGVRRFCAWVEYRAIRIFGADHFAEPR